MKVKKKNKDRSNKRKVVKHVFPNKKEDASQPVRRMVFMLVPWCLCQSLCYLVEREVIFGAFEASHMFSIFAVFQVIGLLFVLPVWMLSIRPAPSLAVVKSEVLMELLLSQMISTICSMFVYFDPTMLTPHPTQGLEAIYTFYFTRYEYNGRRMSEVNRDYYILWCRYAGLLLVAVSQGDFFKMPLTLKSFSFLAGLLRTLFDSHIALGTKMVLDEGYVDAFNLNGMLRVASSIAACTVAYNWEGMMLFQTYPHFGPEFQRKVNWAVLLGGTAYHFGSLLSLVIFGKLRPIFYSLGNSSKQAACYLLYDVFFLKVSIRRWVGASIIVLCDYSFASGWSGNKEPKTVSPKQRPSVSKPTPIIARCSTEASTLDESSIREAVVVRINSNAVKEL